MAGAIASAICLRFSAFDAYAVASTMARVRAAKLFGAVVIEAEVLRQRYDAQAALYLLALHRWLAQRLGEDRMLLRRELEKLALYAGEGGRVGAEDAAACVAEGSALGVEEALMAAVAGDAATADRALDTAFAEGANAVRQHDPVDAVLQVGVLVAHMQFAAGGRILRDSGRLQQRLV